MEAEILEVHVGDVLQYWVIYRYFHKSNWNVFYKAKTLAEAEQTVKDLLRR